MKLIDLLKNIDFNAARDLKEIEDIKIENIAYNSKQAKKDYVFVALDGETTDGHKYVGNAYENGSRVFILSKDVDLPHDSIKIMVKDTRKALSKASSNLFDNPSKKLKVIGITGTKGKTTTSNYIRTILEKAGHSTGLIGTNGVFYKNIKEDTQNTTPESYELQRILNDMVKSGVEFVVMEVSSGGLKMNRVDNIIFDLALFTNISRDHIGPKEHPDFEDYLDSKTKLFKLAHYSIVNIDDKYGDYILDKCDCKCSTFSIKKESDFMAKDIELSRDIKHLGSNFTLKTLDGEYKYTISSPGVFSVYNALTSIAACRYFDISHKIISEVLKSVSVSGRAELLPILDYASIVLDYAHNEVSLLNIVETLRAYEPKRLICLIGSVGNRSNLRRKELGDVAASKCDICILTSDNPDFENPIKIIDEMAQSFEASSCKVLKEEDRYKAIEIGVNLLQKNDILLLAGKGHETYQIIRGEKVHFNDKEAAIEAVKKLKAEK